MDTLSGEKTLLKMFCLPSKEVYAKTINFLPLEANSFLREYTSFQKGIGVKESKQEIIEIVSLVKIGIKSTK